MALISTSVSQKIGILAFNRPEKLNALNAEMLKGFTEALHALTEDDNVRCIIIKGEGRAFSVGYDVSRGGSGYQEGGKPDHDAGKDAQRLRNTINIWMDAWRCPKPVIAQVHGYCVGGVTQLAVFCDLTMVAENAVIGWPALPLGGGLMGPVTAWLIGPKRAKELSFIAGSRMTGLEAAALGWANHAVPEAELASTTLALARQICKTPPDLLAIKKRAINRVMDIQGFSESVVMGAEFDAISHGSAGSKKMKAMLSELGLKEMMRRFKEDDPSFYVD